MILKFISNDCHNNKIIQSISSNHRKSLLCCCTKLYNPYTCKISVYTFVNQITISLSLFLFFWPKRSSIAVTDENHQQQSQPQKFQVCYKSKTIYFVLIFIIS